MRNTFIKIKKNKAVYKISRLNLQKAAAKLGEIEDFEEKIGYPVIEFLFVIEDKLKEWEEAHKEYLKERRLKNETKGI